MTRLAAAVLLAVGLARWSPATPPLLVRHEASRMSMGSAYAIVAYGADANALPGIVREAFDEVDRIDRLMSHYQPDSPLSRLNREADKEPVRVEPELFDFIAEALRYSRESDGAFDITVGPLMKTWGFFRGEGRLPGDDELRKVRRRIGYRHVVLDTASRTIRLERPGMELDLGGIAKGYAVDRVVALLRARGVPAALVSAGGSTVYGLGAPPGRRAWDVEIQDPRHAEKAAVTVPLRNRALSVSGSYEKSFEVDGTRYSHVMDPRTARPVQGVLGVAVLTSSGTAGDALDNVLFVQGVAEGRATLERWPDTEAYFFLPAPASDWRMIHVRGGAAAAAQLPAVKSTTP
ncbi:MAG TPA: FAD:protein FMN transferase [Vicinamibacteria bacterium]|nr:FAD:protein FMN transferase [Vicinamibacteria bacterium]